MASDDTVVFVLLVQWVPRVALHVQCKVQMERWNGTVLDINATCTELGPKCLQLLVHALSGCDTTFNCLYSKGKTRASHTSLSRNIPGLHSVIGEKGILKAELMQTENPFITAMYNQVSGTSMEIARFNLFTKTKVRR